MTHYTEWTHAVPHTRQLTPDSCWWACASMLFRYRLRQDHHISLPEQLDPIFEDRSGESGGLESLQILHPETRASGTLMQQRHYRLQGRREQELLGITWNQGMLHPSHWYRLGVPLEQHHLQYMGELLRLRPVRAFSPASLRQPEAWVRAVRAGPVMLALRIRPGGRVPGSRSSYHFVVVHHVREKEEPSQPTRTQIRFLDPADSGVSDYFDLPAFAENVAGRQVGRFAALQYYGGHRREAELEVIDSD